MPSCSFIKGDFRLFKFIKIAFFNSRLSVLVNKIHLSLFRPIGIRNVDAFEAEDTFEIALSFFGSNGVIQGDNISWGCGVGDVGGAHDTTRFEMIDINERSILCIYDSVTVLFEHFWHLDIPEIVVCGFGD